MAFDANGNWVQGDLYSQMNQIGLPTTPSGFDPNMGSNTGFGTGAPGTVNQLQTLSGYQPWGSGAPAGAGFATKLGSWVSGNGQMIGGVANLASQGLQAFLGLKQLGMAKDALAFEKKSYKTNLRNSVQSYNTQMQDRINGRYYATEAERQQALKDAELSDSMNGKKGG
jgi:hypothetical protein